MKHLSKILIPTLLLTFADIASAHADWQANVVTVFGQGGRQEVSGKIFVKDAKVRLDVSSPTDMSIIHDQKSRTSTALVHAAKIRLEGGFEEYQDRMPVCLPGQIDACFRKLGLKKIRSETVEGQLTEVYQGKVSRQNKMKDETYDLTIWKPVKLKEVPALKTLVVTQSGERIETRFSEITTQVQPASRFTIPKNYMRAGGLEQVIKGLKGFGEG